MITKISPAQVIFGRQIMDFIPVLPHKYNPHPERPFKMDEKESARRKRYTYWERRGLRLEQSSFPG